MNVVDEFYPEEVLRLYFRDRLDNTIERYYYNWQEKYGKNKYHYNQGVKYDDSYYNSNEGIDYTKVNIQQNSQSDVTADTAIEIAELKEETIEIYKYLCKAKKAIKRLLDGLNGKEKNILEFYFSYENELEEACIDLNQSFKEGRKEYKETKKLVRYCCNELDKMLL